MTLVNTFRVLDPSETESAYQILWDASAWLLSRNILQWTKPYPLELYRARQNSGQNFGLFVDGELAVVVSLLAEWPHYWVDQPVPNEPFLWIATLASALRFKGHGLGIEMFRHVEGFAQKIGYTALYLDCQVGVGVLPHYYEAVGFMPIRQKDVTVNGTTVSTLLMKKPLGTI